MSNRDRYLLIISCSYVDDPNNRLYGTYNDAISFRDYLKTNISNIKKIYELHDDPSYPLRSAQTKPTATNMINSMIKILKEANTNKETEVIIYYTGHGTYTYDKNGDEKNVKYQASLEANNLNDKKADDIDSYDEALVPVDFGVLKNGQYNLLTDDMIKQIIQQNGGAKTRVSLFFDCCHSGTLCDLKYNYRYYVNKAGKTTTTLMTDIMNNISDNIKSTVVTFSACSDSQQSAEQRIGNTTRGLMTYGLVQSLKANPSKDVFVIGREVNNVVLNNLNGQQNVRITSNIDLRDPKNINYRYLLDGDRFRGDISISNTPIASTNTPNTFNTINTVNTVNNQKIKPSQNKTGLSGIIKYLI